MALTACSRTPAPSIERIAVVPFDNLTGDPSLDWMASAAATVVASDMAGASKIVPIRAGDSSEGYLAAADRFVRGYFTGKPGELRFRLEVENAATHKISEYISESGAFLPAMNAAATRIDPAARPFSTANEEAAAAWGRGQNEQAVALDPAFGDAWLAWIEALMQKGQTEDAAGVADRALAQPALRTNLSRARIEVLAARLRNDPRARVLAMRKLAALVPFDTSLLANLAEVEMNAHDFASAAQDYRKQLALQPSDRTILNLIGYADGLGGDLDAAQKTLEEYGRDASQKVNSLDSLGEVFFANGKFSRAEQYFLDAHQAAPSFLGGADLLKAAYAHWLADGDLKGADAIMARYLEFRRSQHDPSAGWREASWDYATGRRDLAVEKLKTAPPALAERQQALWRGSFEVHDDLAALARRYQQTPPSSDGEVRVFYAAALLAAGQKEEARKLLVRWPLPAETGGDPMLESLLFPRFIELRKSVGL